MPSGPTTMENGVGGSRFGRTTPYEAVAIMREPMLERHPEVRTAVEELAGKISDDDMRRLNYAVDGQHQDAQQVVRSGSNEQQTVETLSTITCP